MKVRFSGYSLADALVVAGKVVDDSLPNLIKVSSFPGYVQVQATNLESYLTIWVLVESLEEGLGWMMEKGEDTRLLKSSSSLVSVEEFPNFPVPIYQSTLPTKLLLSAVERVEFAIAKHKNAMGYGYLLVDGYGEGVNFQGKGRKS